LFRALIIIADTTLGRADKRGRVKERGKERKRVRATSRSVSEDRQQNLMETRPSTGTPLSSFDEAPADDPAAGDNTTSLLTSAAQKCSRIVFIKIASTKTFR